MQPYTTDQPVAVSVRNVDPSVWRAARAEALRQNIPFGLLLTRVLWLWLQDHADEAHRQERADAGVEYRVEKEEAA